ncbi:hypothetical protein G7046_g7748 [Stylonectria norvegica]|nr:hypothetical protein G7046_g7748 [Stylonectria norvegica]
MAGVAYYSIAGKQVAGHYLAMAWLGTMFAGVQYAMSGPSRPAAAAPPINASSSEEGDFIQCANSIAIAELSPANRDTRKFLNEQEKKA